MACFYSIICLRRIYGDVLLSQYEIRAGQQGGYEQRAPADTFDAFSATSSTYVLDYNKLVLVQSKIDIDQNSWSSGSFRQQASLRPALPDLWHFLRSTTRTVRSSQ